MKGLFLWGQWVHLTEHLILYTFFMHLPKLAVQASGSFCLSNYLSRPIDYPEQIVLAWSAS